MYRCIQLAQNGAGFVAPNPMVGAVLVHEDRIIGEGWHQKFGEQHAEINCIYSVKQEDKHLIRSSTLYVSLEPCAHFGKTPPCADRIIQEQINKVVIGCRDPFKEVDGRGIEKLKAAGVETVVDVLKNNCEQLNKRFFTFQTKQRPFIILKWAQTANGKISGETNERMYISNEFTNRLVHQWRSEEASILVGTNTAVLDDPLLTNRYYGKKQPIRLVIDKQLKLPTTSNLFNEEAETIIFNLKQHNEQVHPQYYGLNENQNMIQQIADALYKLKIQSVLVEGGTKLLQSFIDENLWDEARVITNEEMIIENGLSAPILTNAAETETATIFSDKIKFYQPKLK